MNEIKLEYDGPQLADFNPAHPGGSPGPQASAPLDTNHFELDLGADHGGDAQGGLQLRADASSGGSRVESKRLLLALVLALVGLMGLIHVTGESDDFGENLDQAFEVFMGGGEPEMNITTSPSLSKAKEAATASDEKSLAESEVDTGAVLDAPKEISYENEPLTDEMLANPYWYLPNPLEGHPKPFNGQMSGTDEEFYRNGLSHEYVYQAYKAIRQLRRSRFSGAENVLYDALTHKKFWVRMEATLALAEYGVPITIESLEAALSGARPSLVRNYFKRLRQKPSPGEYHVMRQAIKITDAKGRLQILRNFSRYHFRGNRLYLVAATYDPSPTIQRWLQSELEWHALSGADMREYRRTVVKNYHNGGYSAEDIQAETMEFEEKSNAVIFNDVEFFDEKQPDARNIEDQKAPVFEGEDSLKSTLKSEPVDDGFEEIGGYTMEGEIVDPDAPTEYSGADPVTQMGDSPKAQPMEFEE